MPEKARLRVTKGARRRRGERAIALVLAAVVAIAALRVGGFDAANWRRVSRPRPAVAVAAPRPEAPLVAVQPRPRGTDSSVSRVPLALRLAATRPGRNTREGYADIGVDARSPQTYRASALLANGARIEEIHPDYVLLTRAGDIARLYVEGHAPAGYSPPAAAAAMLTVGGVTSRDEAIADTTEALSDAIRVSPLFEGERFRGLQVYGNERSNAFAQLGLEPGDIIQAIDGERMSDAATAVATLRHLMEGQALTVEVERAGKKAALSLDGAPIVAARAPD